MRFVVLEQIKSSSWRVKWQLREVHKITQWKSGCVYRTKLLGMIVCDTAYADHLRALGFIVGPVSTSVSRLIGA